MARPAGAPGRSTCRTGRPSTQDRTVRCQDRQDRQDRTVRCQNRQDSPLSGDGQPAGAFHDTSTKKSNEMTPYLSDFDEIAFLGLSRSAIFANIFSLIHFTVFEILPWATFRRVPKA